MDPEEDEEEAPLRLEEVLAPVTVEAFRSDYWGKKANHIAIPARCLTTALTRC